MNFLVRVRVSPTLIMMLPSLDAAPFWGCQGFDGDQEAHGACRGSGGPVTNPKNFKCQR